ncbi:4-hydroxythreonine-4-phosphate dehydrogenase PdxA [Candidatus Kinetoplastibacterium sorsogonicusi]|nr:4-hydroxythreonine-4-phosphate dehydrogenase PdxA [Candidatus Kinetoplastibacterium sorsogonicusi]
MFKKLPIGITMGDPCGIGPEIIARACKKFKSPYVVYGDPYVMQQALQLVKNNNLKIIKCNDITEAKFKDIYLNIISKKNHFNDYNFKNYFSNKNIANSICGKASYEYLVNSINDILNKDIKAIVTAPINKESVNQAGIRFSGHTEFLSEATNSKNFAMVMLNNNLKVLLVTRHIPLSSVSKNLTIELEINSIKLANKACLQMGIKHPKIGVAALNPHCGEGGLFGKEEIEIIKPAILQTFNEGINVSGPWSGDIIFMKANRGEFDIIVSQYHDQGIIPIKLNGLDNGINLTIGLPFIRTSVDHGTAFDIAWKGIASSSSLESAFTLADNLQV